MTRELEKNIFISSSGVIWNGGGFLRLKKPVSIFLLQPLSPIFYNQPQGKWRKGNLFTFWLQELQISTMAVLALRENTHRKKKAMSHFQIKKTFLHVSITHRLLPFEANPSKFSSLSSVVAKSRPLSAVPFHSPRPSTPHRCRDSLETCVLWYQTMQLMFDFG